jgi:5S rRNA maturation endonuclease (ribonuclease M5)
MLSEQELLARFEHVQRLGDGSWKVTCPCHDDRTPSLHITMAEDRWLLWCGAKCPTDEVRQAARLDWSDLFAERSNGKREIVETYPYTDERGALLFEAVRYHPKDFRQRRPDGTGGWTWDLKGTQRVLYRLPRVREAIEVGTPIYVVEGERDVHAIERAGAVATTNPMGAGKWRSEYTEALRGAARVVIVADSDAKGRAHAREVAAALTGLAEEVQVVQAKEGKDAADHLRAGHGLDEFVPAPDWREMASAEQLEELTVLLGAEQSVVAVEMYGRGSQALVIIRLADDGGEIRLDPIGHYATTNKLGAELALQIGAAPDLTAVKVTRILVLIRQLASLHRGMENEDRAADLGLIYLRAAPVEAVRMGDQADRWRAFSLLDRLPNPAAASIVASASLVLEDPDSGLRYVRASWFDAHVRQVVGPGESRIIARSLLALGWQRPPGRGRIKATCPSRNDDLKVGLLHRSAALGGTVNNACQVSGIRECSINPRARTRARAVKGIPADTWIPAQRGGSRWLTSR